jgi:hypothetical protein
LLHAPKPAATDPYPAERITGPFQIHLRSAGHKITTFNRGKTHPGELKEVEQLTGDRNVSFDALKGRKWDVAHDNPTSLPVGSAMRLKF